MIAEIVALLKLMPIGSQTKVRDFAQAELTRLVGKQAKRRREKKNPA